MKDTNDAANLQTSLRRKLIENLRMEPFLLLLYAFLVFYI